MSTEAEIPFDERFVTWDMLPGIVDDPDTPASLLVQFAKNPDSIIEGNVYGDPVTSAEVMWPGNVPGVMTVLGRHATGAITSYRITYGSPVTKTFTQPTISRSSTGAATFVPAMLVETTNTGPDPLVITGGSPVGSQPTTIYVGGTPSGATPTNVYTGGTP